ncbi:response regulator [Maridesulfovibrio bastinii]|uniref:response regulator n=1 Tax=Maridesulfovibrio bastinii TaxID=47157 RepID=UPI000554365B|nr:response regulator [Maridesulfovibrio bastinii]
MTSERILVVEDSLTQAVKLEYFLSSIGYSVLVADDGESAISKMDSFNPDLVISDVVMPGMDGYELCSQIRQNDKFHSVPVILLTSLSDPGDVLRGLKSGAINFVTKPYDEDFLHSRIRHVLDHNHYEAETGNTREIEFEFHGEKHSISADFGQVFHLLLATYENALLQSKQLDQAYRQLAHQEEQLRSVLASISSSIAVLDTGGRLITANPSWNDYFAIDTGETLVGSDFLESLSAIGCPEDILVAVANGLKEVINGHDEHFLIEFSYPFKGEKKWCQLDITPMGGETGGAVAAVIDITGRKKLERELIMARDGAQKANKFKSRFLASMSHEIRTPLNAVIGLTDLTLLTDLNVEQRDNLETVGLCANQLLSVVNDILDLSKVEARMLKLENEDFSLSDVLYSVVRSLSHQAESKGLVIDLDIDEDVPEIVCGDQGRLKQVLFNLIGNALKFTGKGGVYVQVSPSIDQNVSGRHDVVFTVRDTGIGIPEDQQDVIFESFRQADSSTTRKFGGTGLGLAISREIVEMMGGQIGVRSSVGLGSVFTFNVLLSPGDPDKVELYALESDTLPDADKKRFHILLVEDNSINVRVAGRLLKKMGHTCREAENGVKAVEALSKEHFDLVLMDIEMPEMDGFDAAKAIRQGGAGSACVEIPIIAMSAHAMSGTRDKSIKSGMNGYITKPVQYADLEAKIQKVMEGRADSGDHDFDENEHFGVPVLDRQKAEEMYHGDNELFEELCSMFLEETPEDLRQLLTAASRRDFRSAERIAHTLKSTCAAICAPRARDIAYEMEKAFRYHEGSGFEKLVESFKAENKRISEAIESYK